MLLPSSHTIYECIILAFLLLHTGIQTQVIYNLLFFFADQGLSVTEYNISILT